MVSECQYTRRICRELTALGCYVQVNAGSRYGTAGFPDRTVILPCRGVVWFFEFKSETGKVSALQATVMRELIRRGANVKVIRVGE